ncbi:hypothetical protein EJB05_00090, partial [Eragrostis curvula]
MSQSSDSWSLRAFHEFQKLPCVFLRHRYGKALNSEALEETKMSRCVLLAHFRRFINLTPLPELHETH